MLTSFNDKRSFAMFLKFVVLGLCVHLVSFDQVYAQSRQISGVVTSATDQNPLPGVSIQVKDSGSGTRTDANGQYTLEAAAGSTLVFSYIGFVPQEIALGENNVLNVQLREDSQNLEEVVVVGYGTQKRKDVTSAIATVKAEDFNPGGARSPMELIQGKVAGLNITRTQGSNPNAGTAIQLRGVTSLTGTTTPLIVIDGIPGGNLDLLAQDDIESIDVLKDGSAAAIYGTRGNAGVILVTTKKGASGAPRFDYYNYFQREVVDRKPSYLDAQQFRNLIAEGAIPETEDFGASTDLYDELINKNNLSHYHNLVASGGTDKSNYRGSLYYTKLEGIAKQNDRETIGTRVNFNQKGLDDRLQMQFNIAASFNKSNLLGGGVNDDGTTNGADFEQAVQRNPTAPIRNPDGTFFETQAFNNYNPMSRLEYRVFERQRQIISGDARLTYNITDDLSVGAFGAYVWNNFNDRRYRSTEDFAQRPASEWQGFGWASKQNELTWTKTFEPTINYQKTFNGDHNFGAVLGYMYQYSTLERFNVNNNGFTTDGFLDWNLGAGSAINNTALPRPGMSSFKEDNTLIAFFGRVTYNYKSRYNLQFILRREGSSRFGANNKWGNFPAVSAAWNVGDEDFMEEITFIDNLKFRAGYGITGNQGIDNYQSLVTLGTGGVYPQNGVYYQTYGAARNPNPNLRWERKAEWNFGLDFTLFDGFLNGAFDVYNRNTRDLLYRYTAQQPSFVRDQIYTNVGSINNRGVELALSATAIRNKDFEWDISLAANSQFNRLTQLSSDVFRANWIEFGGLPSPGNLGNAIRLEEGGAVGNFFGKRFAGFDEDGRWLFQKADGTVGRSSEMNENDLSIIGNGVPNYVANITQNFRYKNFDLSIMFRGKFAYDILNTQDMYFGNRRWLPNNILESAITTHAELDDDPQYSDYYVERGDFIRLDNITLGYNFRLNTDKVRSLRIYATGRNVATITGYTGIDPELQDIGFTAGIDNRSFYPRTTSWTVGLNVGF